MTYTSQEIYSAKLEKYQMTERIVNEASEKSIMAHEHARTTTVDKLEAERIARHQYEYLQCVIATAKRHTLVYDEKLQYLQEKLKYEETGDERYGEIVRMKDACMELTCKYVATIDEVLHAAQSHMNLIVFYSESSLFYYQDTSIALSRGSLNGHYTKMLNLFIFDSSPKLDIYIYELYKLARKIRQQHTNPSATEFIRRCREKYVIPLTVRRVERCSRILKTETPLVDDTICEIVSFIQSAIERRHADTIIYRAM